MPRKTDSTGEGKGKAPRSQERGAVSVSEISPEDFLYVYGYYSQAKTWEQAQFLKLKAMATLLRSFPKDSDYDIRYGVWALKVIADHKAPVLSKLAAAVVLDFMWPEWRQEIKPEYLGPAVTRQSPEVYAWRKSVLARDNWTCTQCGSKKRLQAHHILMWKHYPHARLLVDNGTTLCYECHLPISVEQRRQRGHCVA